MHAIDIELYVSCIVYAPAIKYIFIYFPFHENLDSTSHEIVNKHEIKLMRC